MDSPYFVKLAQVFDINMECIRWLGRLGSEPGDGGIKIRCLTTRLRPIGRKVGAPDHTDATGQVNAGSGGPAHQMPRIGGDAGNAAACLTKRSAGI